MNAPTPRSLPTSIFMAAINCAHVITDATVKLKQDKKLGGTALEQLQERLLVAARAEFGVGRRAATIGSVTYLAAINGAKKTFDDKSLRFGADDGSDRNALGQFGDRMDAAFAAVMDIEAARAPGMEHKLCTESRDAVAAVRLALHDLISLSKVAFDSESVEPKELIDARIALATFDVGRFSAAVNVAAERASTEDAPESQHSRPTA